MNDRGLGLLQVQCPSVVKVSWIFSMVTGQRYVSVGNTTSEEQQQRNRKRCCPFFPVYLKVWV